MTQDDTGARLTTHEAVCAERYIGIMARMGRIESIIICAAAALLAGMAGLIVTLALRAP